jgi:polar amino acid transport system substrate-binding protein
VRIGVETRPHTLGPTDYQTRRAANFLAETADTLARQLGVRVTFVEIARDSAIDALNAGLVDLLLGYQPPRAPHGSASELPLGERAAIAPLMRNDTNITRWEDFAGHTVCVADGQPAAREAVAAIDAKMESRSSVAKALANMRAGECDAALADARLIDGLITAPTNRWIKFSTTLPPRFPTQLVLTVRQGDLAGRRLLERYAATLGPDHWSHLRAQWTADVDFEAYLEQDAPDCH